MSEFHGTDLKAIEVNHDDEPIVVKTNFSKQELVDFCSRASQDHRKLILDVARAIK